MAKKLEKKQRKNKFVDKTVKENDFLSLHQEVNRHHLKSESLHSTVGQTDTLCDDVLKNLAFLGSFSSLLKVVVSDSLPLLFTLKSLSFTEFFGDRKTSSTFLPSILVFLCFRSKPKETINFRQSKVEIEKQVKKNRGQAMKEKEERDAA